MSGTKEEAPSGWRAETGLEGRFARASNLPNIVKSRIERHPGGMIYRVWPDVGEPFDVTVKGRPRWALERLREAGEGGCTPSTEPAPRWSAYVHVLRHLGVPIETVNEKHDGPFAGTQGRYVLRCDVRRVEA